jgi:hypothetical protein
VPRQVAAGLERIPFELHASIVLLALLLLPLHPICGVVVRRRLLTDDAIALIAPETGLGDGAVS